MSNLLRAYSTGSYHYLFENQAEAETECKAETKRKAEGEDSQVADYSKVSGASMVQDNKLSHLSSSPGAHTRYSGLSGPKFLSERFVPAWQIGGNYYGETGEAY